MTPKNFYLDKDPAAQIKELKIGDMLYLNGTLYTARDQAHKRIAEAINNGEKPPFDLDNACIYYCGPTPKAEGEVIGSCGPTTSGRMDSYAPLLYQKGVIITVGKGVRSEAVVKAIQERGGAYFSAIGGAAALYKNAVISSELVAYEDLGCEAIYKLKVRDFPVVVTNK